MFNKLKIDVELFFNDNSAFFTKIEMSSKRVMIEHLYISSKYTNFCPKVQLILTVLFFVLFDCSSCPHPASFPNDPR